MEGYGKKIKSAIFGHIPIELTAVMLNDENSNDRRQVNSKNIGVQAELTTFILNEKREQFTITCNERRRRNWRCFIA